MKHIKFLIIGILFGIIMTKSEAISWFRIQEMFRFQAIHMYGIIGSALVFGIIFIALIKKFKMKTIEGNEINIPDKEKGFKKYFYGGTVFGLGWALSGACPGPMYTLLGNGFTIFIVVIFGALLGTYVYGLVRSKLPH